MGVGFEFIQLAGKYPNKFTMALSAPGLAMQRITTAEPDGPIVEVAIEAMKAALTGEVPEKEAEKEQAEDEGEVFESLFDSSAESAAETGEAPEAPSDDS